MRIVSIIVVILVILFFPEKGISQKDTEFWFVAPFVNQGHGNSPVGFRLFTYNEAANITVSQPANPAFTPINLNIPPNSAHTLDLTAFLNTTMNSPENTVLNYGYQIVSDKDISAYYEVMRQNNPDIFTLKGRNALGTDFMIPHQNVYVNGNYNPPARGGFDIVATEDNTTITITPKYAMIGHPAGVPFTIVLNKGQTYSCRTINVSAAQNPMGSTVVSDKPIAITINDDSIINVTGGCRDLIGDQIFPLDHTGKEFVLVRGFINGGDRIFVTAPEDNTEISINGVYQTTINSGDIYTYVLNDPQTSIFLSTNKNVYVLQGTGFGCELGIAIIPALECTGSIEASFTRSTTEFFGLFIIAKAGSEGNFLFNGNPNVITAGDFSVVPGSGGQYMAARKELSLAVMPANSHAIIENTEDFFHFGIINGGASSGCRFGFLSDFATYNFQISASQSYYCNGDSLVLTATSIQGAEYEWVGPGGFSSGETNVVISPANTSHTGLYIVSGSVGNCPVLPDSVYVEINEYPEISITPFDPLCKNDDPVILQASPPGGSWQGPGVSNNIFNPALALTGNNTLNYSFSIEECTSTESLTILVNPNPEPSANNSGPYCPGETLELNTGNYVSYFWTGPQNFNSNNQNPTVPNVNASHAGVYSLTVIDQNNCDGTVTTDVTVNPAPAVMASNSGPVCEGTNFNLIAEPSNLSSYQWSGPQGYTGTGSSPLVTNTTPNMSGTYTVTVTSQEGCTAEATTNVTIDAQVYATISPVPDVCENDPTVILTAQTPGGSWSGTGVSSSGFNPGVAGVGTHTIHYEVSNGECFDSDQTTVTVYDNIYIQNYVDTACNATATAYYVTFNVVDANGNPIGFYADYGNGPSEYFGNFSQEYPTQTSYSITVTDLADQCNQYILNGYTDCGCLTYAGTMESLQILKLCYGDCTDEAGHNDNQYLDADDSFQFILHDGSYPANIIAINNSAPQFCFHLIPGLNFGQIYYISAIAGDSLPNGNVDQTDDCYSQSQGTPVVWYDNPIPHINTFNFTTCGYEYDISAAEPGFGMTGTWSSASNFWPINGTTIHSPDITVLIDSHGEHSFTWTLIDGVCSASTSVTGTFLATPTAYAGENFATCGLTANLNAVFSLPGSTGQWSGPGTFSPSTSPDATVTVTPPYGQYTFSWRENLEECWTEDQVTVTFIQEPNPSIIPSIDTVCGTFHQLNVQNVQGSGQWSAYSNGVLLSPQPQFLQGINNPNTGVIIPNYQGHFTTVEFVWTESFQVLGVECSGSVSQTVYFAREPNASVGPNNEAEVCGYSYTLHADTIGSGWASGRWINNTVIHHFDDFTLPNATVTVDSLGNFGDSSYVRAPFLWVVNNMGCTSIDTMWINFYKKPKAYAGFDNAVCGNHYKLGAVFSLPETQNYNPYGQWFVQERPVPEASANIVPTTGDSVNVTVSHYGEWLFRFRENNANLSSCYSTDTVMIEFVEIPVVDAGNDKDVCGQCTNLEAISSPEFDGSWVGTGASFEDYNDPNTGVCVNTYGGINFVWMESSQGTVFDLTCTSHDTVKITFWRQPISEILTDDEDSTACGLYFNHLRAQPAGSGVTGYWYNVTDPDPVYGNVYSNNTNVTVSSYGYHDFYWITHNGPQYQPDFCNDTAGPLTIHFIEIPTANAGDDILFCGKTGTLGAIPSVGTGVWSTPSTEQITFENINDPNTQVTSTVHTGTSANPYFILIWTEDNTNECTDKDTIKVEFARIPSSDIHIIPPKCLGEAAILSATETEMIEYDWDFSGGVVDSVTINQQGGDYEYLVRWPFGDIAHRISLSVTNQWGCSSPLAIDSVFEPQIPDFDVTVFGDTCLLGKGAIVFLDTIGQNAFYWLNSDYGPSVGQPVTAVYNLPEGEYDIRARYRTPNTHWSSIYLNVFGNDRCTDTVTYEIVPIGLLYAEFIVPPEILDSELVAPEAEVIFLNNSDFDGVSRRCIWHFGDGNTLTSCDEEVSHIYAEPGCFEPFLIIMNRDLQECRDTAYIDFCIKIDQESSIEVPNVFTPDGDGINDYFQVKAESLRSFQAYIVNRWGSVVYEWTNWQDEDAGWDGKLSGGSKASTGVYYYIINAVGKDDVEYDLRGHLHLLR